MSRPTVAVLTDFGTRDHYAGTIKAVVTERYSEPEARFEVETPTAIAGVRGTSFLASYDTAQEATLVVGLERVTRVRALVDPKGAAQVDLGPGIATRVRRGRRPLAPARLPENQLRPMLNATALGARTGSGRPGNRVDARRPQRPGERAMSTEEQAVDQPLFKPTTPKPPPPPPPVPRGRR